MTEQQRAAMQAALEALEANDEWHRNYDDYAGYDESELAEQNLNARNALRVALAKPTVKPSEIAINAWKLRMIYYDDAGEPQCNREPEQDELRDALAEPQPEPERAPWTDFLGQPIRHGDLLTHPNGEEFIAVKVLGNHEATDAWRAVYEMGSTNRLCLQIGDIGRAVLASAPKDKADSFNANADRLRIAGVTLIGLAEHDQRCGAFDLDDDGRHMACSCGLDESVKIIADAAHWTRGA